MCAHFRVSATVEYIIINDTSLSSLESYIYNNYYFTEAAAAVCVFLGGGSVMCVS